MKFMLSLLALVAVVSAGPAPSLPVNPGGIGGLFKGPNGETIIQGPDGSVITSAVKDGEVRTTLEPIVVAEPASGHDVVPSVLPIASELPGVVPSGRIDTVTLDSPDVENKQSSDLIGPSGRIITEGLKSIVAGPASTTISGPGVVAETVVKGPPIIASPAPILTSAQLPTITTSLLNVGAIPAAQVSAVATPISVSAAPLLQTDLGSSIEISSITSGSLPLSVTSAPVAPGLLSVTAAPPQTILSSTPSNLNQPIEINVSVTPSPLPILSSTLIPEITGLQLPNEQVSINNQINLGPPQLLLNPELIPVNNVIPPEIGLRAPNVQNIPRRLLTTPGLGVVGPGTNIQREENDSGVPTGLPNVIGVQGRFGQLNPLTQEQQLALQNLQNQQGLVTSGVPTGLPNVIQAHERLGLNPLSQEQQLALQNQQNLVTNQNPNIQSVGSQNQRVVDIRPRNEILLKQNGISTYSGLQQEFLRPTIPTNIQPNSLLPQDFANHPQQKLLRQTVAPTLASIQQQELLRENVAPSLGTIQQQEILQQNIAPTLSSVQQQELLRQSVAIQQQGLLQPNVAPSLVSVQQQELLNQNAAPSLATVQQEEILRQNIGIELQGGLFRPNGVSLADVQQQELLTAQLVKSGIDPTQLHLTNVPLSSIQPLNLNDNLGAEAWGRSGREVSKKNEKKKEKKH